MNGRVITLTVVNPHATQPLAAEIGVRGVSAADVRAVTLSAADIHAHNTFTSPEAVRPRAERADAMQRGVLVHTFPAASVIRLTLTLDL